MQLVMQAKKAETYPNSIRHPMSNAMIPAETVKRGEQLYNLLIRLRKIEATVDEDPLEWSLEDILGGVEPNKKMKKLAFSTFQPFFTKSSIEISDECLQKLSVKELKVLAKEMKGMYLRNLEPFQRKMLCPTSNGQAFGDFPYWEHSDRNPWIYAILSNINYILTDNKSCPEHLIKMAMYIFTGAVATICPEVKERYQDSFALDFDLTGGGRVPNNNNNNTANNNGSQQQNGGNSSDPAPSSSQGGGDRTNNRNDYGQANFVENDEE
jgi:hypothetical protein